MTLKGKKVLVTGGAGFLGSHLSDALLKEGAHVRILDIFSSGRHDNVGSFGRNLELVQGDLADKNLVAGALQNIDVVIHTAFPMEIRMPNPPLAGVKSAAAGFLNLLECCIKEKALFVEISSIAVYGDEKYLPVDEKHPMEPETVYGVVKLAEEEFCRVMRKTQGLKTIILRVADIYGPRNTRVSVPIKFLHNACLGKANTVHGTGTQGRTFTYVSDFVKGVLCAVTSDKAEGEVFNIAGARFISMLELAETVKEVTVSHLPITFDREKVTDSRKLEIDISKAREIIKFNPEVDLAQGLRLTYEWILKNMSYWK
ncbi:MAG: GDP-mannose 4,6-dehydratase [Desulfitobacteriaceae bacterium]|nr:GDP-mannose 4,6-dehydratase [Desulfitobacteriaceae bacterium]